MRYLSADDRGSILILTLFVLAMLTVFCVHLGYGVRQKLTLVAHLDQRDRLRLATEAAVKAGIGMVEAGDDTGPVDLAFRYGSGTFGYKGNTRGTARCSYSDGFCTVKASISDEGGKININRAGMGVMTALLQDAAGLDEASAAALACCIIDWRDADSFYQHPQHGAEDSDYRRGPAPYEAKDADFEIFDELLLVKSVTCEIFEAMAGHFTVYGPGTININTASKEVLSALGMSGPLVDKIACFRLGVDSVAGTEDDNRLDKISDVIADLKGFIDLLPEEEKELGRFISKGTFTTHSSYFTISSIGAARGRNVVCQIVSAVKEDGTILFWHEK